MAELRHAQVDDIPVDVENERLFVLTYTTRRRLFLGRARHTWEKVCTWDEALAMQATLRAEGALDCEVRHG